MKMNLLVRFAVGLLAGTLVLGAEKGAAAPRLKGIAVFSTNQIALLEVEAPQRWRRELLLAKGEREGDLEVLEIDASSGRVRINNAGETIELTFDPDTLPQGTIKPLSGDHGVSPLNAPAFLRLQQAGPGHVFSLYQLLVQRTLIRPASLPDFHLDLYSNEGVTTTELARSIEQALARHGIVIKPEGDKFAVAGKVGEPPKITAQVRQAAAEVAAKLPQVSSAAHEKPKETPKASTEGGEELIPPGVICFREADLEQVLAIYQDLTDRTLIRPPQFREWTVSLVTCTPLTKSEAIFAFSALLAVNDISVIPEGEKFLFVIPTTETNKVAALVRRKTTLVATAGEKTTPAAVVKFRSAELGQLLSVLQDLCGRSVEIDAAGVPRPLFNLSTQTPLTRGETLRGLELLLGLEGLALLPQEDGKSLKVVRLEEMKLR